MNNLLCISIDGLRCDAIGAYGNTWIQTPAFDALACQSALFDRFYTSSLHLPSLFDELWKFFRDDSFPDCRKVLLTDDSDVFFHAQESWFDEKHHLESTFPQRPAQKIEGTQLYRNMATLADLLHRLPHDNQSHKPFLFWAHFEGLRRCWDFPLSYRKRYQIDEDPAPYPGVTLPNIHTTDNNSGITPNTAAPSILDPVLRHSILEAYCGGIAVLDETLAGLLAFLRAEGLDKNTVLLFMSTRGFNLGEHNTIGACNKLYGENVHLPLLICFPDGSFSGFRSQTLLQPADIGELLKKGEIPTGLPCDLEAVHSSLRIVSVPAGISMPTGNVQTGEGGEDSVGDSVEEDATEEVIVTPNWFIYRKPDGDELYVKPDDRWEVNNVFDRCSYTIEEIYRPDQK